MINNEDNVCEILSCSVDLNTYNGCLSLYINLLDGTPCESGKLCMNGKCVSDSKAQNDECALGDGLIIKNYLESKNYPPYPIECDEFLNNVSKFNYDPTGFCSDTQFRKQCCNACKSILNILCYFCYKLFKFNLIYIYSPFF